MGNKKQSKTEIPAIETGASGVKGRNLSYEKAIELLQEFIDESSEKNATLSRDINEDINQNLAALKLKIAHVMRMAEKSSAQESAGPLSEIDRELSRIMAQLRTISYELEHSASQRSAAESWREILGKAFPEMSKQDVEDILRDVDC